MIDTKTNLAVIGTGAMGSNHVRVLSEMENVNLIAISDISQDTLNRLSSQYHILKTYTNHQEMLTQEKENLDGVVIAVPSAFHKKVVLDCFQHDLPVLVEKPIAHTLEDAQEMIDKAKEKNLLFTVGHIERFNPIVTKLKEFLDQNVLGEIYLVNTTRAGPFPKRLYGLQDGVLIDLSVHDVDIIQHLIGNIKKVHSQLIFSEKQEIYAKSLFQIENNIKGSAEFSWISPKRTRLIEIFGTKGILRGDYQTQEISFYENSDDSETALTKGSISEGRVIKYPIYKQEPLKIELKHFVDCLKNKQAPLVSSEDAQRNLKIALSILSSGKEDRSIHI